MPEVAVRVIMQHGNSNKRPFHSSFLLISYEPFVLCEYVLPLGWACHYRTICIAKWREQS